MNASEINRGSDAELRNERLLKIIHGLSQPLTTLECGLELGLRYDTNLAQVRKRLGVLLEAAYVMHQRLMELRALRMEREPSVCEMQGGTNEPTIPSKF